jgi:hypothetical protein
MVTSRLELLYWMLAAVGTVLPLAAVGPWFIENGLDPIAFFGEIFDSPVDAMFGWDVLISMVALWAFVLSDFRRSGVKAIWAPLGIGSIVGVSLGLPLYLALRERALHKARSAI